VVIDRGQVRGDEAPTTAVRLDGVMQLEEAVNPCPSFVLVFQRQETPQAPLISLENRIKS